MVTAAEKHPEISTTALLYFTFMSLSRFNSGAVSPLVIGYGGSGAFRCGALGPAKHPGMAEGVDDSGHLLQCDVPIFVPDAVSMSRQKKEYHLAQCHVSRESHITASLEVIEANFGFDHPEEMLHAGPGKRHTQQYLHGGVWMGIGDKILVFPGIPISGPDQPIIFLCGHSLAG